MQENNFVKIRTREAFLENDFRTLKNRQDVLSSNNQSTSIRTSKDKQDILSSNI